MTVTNEAPSRWLMRFHPLPAAPVRLICFPHAGGSASYYHPLSRRFGTEAEVVVLQYPGRQDRRFEPVIEDIGVLADRVTEQLRTLSDKPTVYFGHSMGAIVAFETACRFEAAGLPVPRSLIVSGRRAPSTWRAETVHRRDDAGVIAEVQRLGGTDVKLIDDELLRLALPSIRGDYRAIESYTAVPDRRVSSPIVALAGADDPLTTTEEISAWAAHTSGGFRRQVFPGGHFFIASAARAVQDEIARELDAIRAVPAC
jgi:surfactin synthase thioesterase subunit